MSFGYMSLSDYARAMRKKAFDMRDAKIAEKDKLEGNSDDFDPGLDPAPIAAITDALNDDEPA